MSDSKKNQFGALVSELETLLAGLENGDLPLEEAMATFERGIQITRDAQSQLFEAEQKVSSLTGGESAKCSTVSKVVRDE